VTDDGDSGACEDRRMDRRAYTWWAFGLWCVAGTGLALGVISILTIGFAVLFVTLVLCGFLLWKVGFGPALTGIITGAAAPVLYVAWLNRDGPGSHCIVTATSSSCTDEWTPWPFLVVAVAMVVAGVVSFVWLRGAQSRT
jgi:hypothetical protein